MLYYMSNHLPSLLFSFFFFVCLTLFIFFLFFFFFNDTATTEIYTLSLHDALPICHQQRKTGAPARPRFSRATFPRSREADRKSTRLNSSHSSISYAVFCLKKKKKKKKNKNQITNKI